METWIFRSKEVFWPHILGNCSQHLAEVQRSKVAQADLPECQSDGTYSALQRHAGGLVSCVSKGGKEIIRGPQIKACKCPRERWESEDRNRRGFIGGFTPSCNDTTGTYSPLQIHGPAGYEQAINK